MDNITESKMEYTPEGISMIFVGVAGAVASSYICFKKYKTFRMWLLEMRPESNN